MKVLHTADWHIGQLFHGHDRTYEHQQFLYWLVQTIKDEQVGVLLISGDVFDQSNPSAAAVKMFYRFLNQATKANPHLQIIVTAGNHDSAPRLESPKPLLESSNIHIIGLIEKDEAGNIDYEKLIIPLKDQTGATKAWCLAIPFLRIGDYPVIPNADNPYAEGIAALYQQVYQHALAKKQNGQAIICMGHLHTQQAEITDLDTTERLIMGGVEHISPASFHEDINYVALGHIHKAQRIGGKEHIRYCGSPLPMSFSELHYKHQVLVFTLNEKGISSPQPIEVPLAIPLLRVPSTHSSLPDVLLALQQLPDTNGDPGFPPYLQVCVLLDGPEPSLRHQVEKASAGKHVRLTKIDSRYRNASAGATQEQPFSHDRLNELKPLDVFTRVYESKYNTPVPEAIQQLFNQVAQEVSQIQAT
ncbi:exonuclease SbcCD subunit D C-terminal domain-containing protein [Chitinophaga sp. GbtcB8]|uniref:exonuclease SbcCD subunit D C-terminal domain-containing protein n=1 Tax=Chitinophaga sp. GbtcB8 TaxID=2824753 RepID=UPI001C30B9D9|nr:exonuclease SbcCD subunit D C-terminal domain-containing protein [Chitinophaga sp. GbtcB8]